MSGRKRKQNFTILKELDPEDDMKVPKERRKEHVPVVGKENIKRSKVEVPDSDSDDDDILLSLKAKGIRVSIRSSKKESPENVAKARKSETRKQLFSDDSPSMSSRKRKSSSAFKVEEDTHLLETDSHTPKKIKFVNKSSSTSIESCNTKLTTAGDALGSPEEFVKNLQLRLESQLRRSSDKKNKNYEIQLTEKSQIRSPALTPCRKSHPSVGHSLSVQGTPESKIKPKCATPKTPLECARTSLHVASVPKSLPCRDAEYQNILNFVQHKVSDGIGGCMYISGVPGTGKTATVTQVIKHLQETAVKGDLPKFNFIEINGMRLSDPRQVYVLLYQKIFNSKDRVSADVAHRKLEIYFNKEDKKKITTVAVIDELDLLCTRKQEVVYNLLEWPSKPNSRLVVMTIANTMDMPERKLKGKINSRLGLARLTFLPYTHKQLEEIVLDRLQGNDAFVVDAVRLATRKVAAVSGDARRALDICRRAAELPADNEPVRIVHIEKAIKEMTNSNVACHIRGCSKMERMFLQSLSEVCIRTGVDEVCLSDIASQMLTMCVLEGLTRPPIPAFLEICQRLRCSRFLFTNDHRTGLLQRLTLNVSQDDLYYGLKDVCK